MTMNELLNAVGIKKPSLRIKKHPKMLQVLKYCNDHDIDIYENGMDINEDAFLVLLENIHSIETLAEILKNSAVLLSIDFNPKEIALFYNLYDPEVLQYNTESEILIDKEYLKYATKEWTEKYFLAQPKVLHVSKNRMMLRNNPRDCYDEDYLETSLLNLVALKKAKDLGLLKEAIKKISE